MSYLVLARKYRPQSFGEMSGQEHVVRTLSNALKTGQLAHAFLFTGPRGVGKTTCARLVAKCLDCAEGPTATPCGVCAACVEIAEGRCVDVVEIDAASNNGVDNVRDIVEAVKYRPARDRFKVFVIDEVHMLSAGAFNALLKTLEEPPPHVKFVLATTDVHKVPETIVSRCQRFDFRRLTQQQIVETLRKVAEAEHLRISDRSLAVIARAAEGGMRDALSTLDQVRAACGDQADDAAVAEAVGAVDGGAVARIAGAIFRRDGAAVLGEIEALHARGQEMKRVAEELVGHLRNVVVARLVPDAPLDLADADRREVLAQAQGAPPSQLTRVFDLAQRAISEVKRADQPRYALEVALLKACFLAPAADVNELVSRLEAVAAGQPPPAAPRGGGPGAGSTRTGGAPASAGPRPERAGPAPVRGEGSPVPGFQPVDAAPAPAVTPAAPSAAPAGGADPWRAIVAEVERASPALASALKLAVPLAITEAEVSVRMPPGMQLSSLERRRGDVEAAFARLFGRSVKLTITPGAATEPAPEGATVGPARSIAEVDKAEREARSADVRAKARAHSKIQEAVRILGGDVTDVEEL